MNLLFWRRKSVNEDPPKDFREALVEVLFAAESTLPRARAYDPVPPKYKRLRAACQMVSQYIEHGVIPEEKDDGSVG